MAVPTDMRPAGLPMPLLVAVIELLGVALVVGGLVAWAGWAGVAIAAGALLVTLAVGMERRMGAVE